jgi:hypothetical protein
MIYNVTTTAVHWEENGKEECLEQTGNRLTEKEVI